MQFHYVDPNAPKNRCGLDTMICIMLIEKGAVVLQAISNIFSEGEIEYFISEWTEEEVIRVLQRKGYTMDSAEQSFEEMMANLNFKYALKDDIDNSMAKFLVKTAIEMGINPQNVHANDGRIIASFLRANVNVAFSNDNGFAELAKIAKIDCRKLGDISRIISDIIQGPYQHRR